MIGKNMFKKPVSILLFTIIIVAFLFTTLNIINKPNKEIITDIIINNGIKINGSDSNDVNIVTNEKYDHISIHLEKEEIKNIEILEAGYDFIQMKYFCIVDISTYREEYSLRAKLILFLQYDKGWQLVDKIGVLDANFEVEK